VRLVGYLKINK